MPDLLFEHYSRGKLLLSGEYYVLDGAKALAVPTKSGQKFMVEASNEDTDIIWQSLDFRGNVWFEASFMFESGFIPVDSSDPSIADKLVHILNSASDSSKTDIASYFPCKVTTWLEFPRHWGLGSSSTLTSSIAAWFEVDPFILLESTIGGSGYDIAAAAAKGPFLYVRAERPVVEPVRLDWPFKNDILFVGLNRKQDSGEGIRHYRSVDRTRLSDTIQKVSHLTETLVSAVDTEAFAATIDRLEGLVAGELGLQKAKDLYFHELKVSVKSLGAWGGDFVMLVCQDTVPNIRKILEARGFTDILTWEEMVLE